jgi:DNA helicase-2/ATP-dependent DNA helicase PcrA
MVEGLLREFSLLKGTLRLLDLPEGRLTRHVAEDFGLNFDTLKIFRAYEYLRTHNGDEPGDVAFRYQEDGCFDLAMRVVEGDVFRDDRPALCLNLSLLLVDEMHDMNRAMFKILCALLQANPGCHFVGVGDPDQVIHNTNGADSAFMGEEFRMGLGAPTRLSLTQTFRFGQKLADLLGTSYDKPYRCFQPHADRTQVEHYQAGDSGSQPARFCAAKISDELHLHPSASIAVLVRDRHQSIDVERLLLDRGLRYTTHGLDPYWARPETLLVRILFAHSQTEYAYANISEKTRLAMVRTLIECTGRSPEDLQLSLSGIEKTCRNDLDGASGNNSGLDYRMREVVDLILRESPNKIRSHLAAARDCFCTDDEAEFKHHFAKHLAPKKLSELIFVQQQDRDLFCQGISGLVKSISERETGLSAFFQSVNQQEAFWSQADRSASKIRLRVSSIEAAKGLEFDTVFLYGFDTQTLGQKIISASDTKNPLYVGATRARRQLFLVDVRTAAPPDRT